jgi:hypothetical protein
MELRRSTASYLIVLVLVISNLIGCRGTTPSNPPTTQNPAPPQPVPPTPCKSGGKFQVHCFSIPADTPVVASGSSIDLNAKNTFQGNNTKFTVTGNDIGWLFFDGIDQFPASQQFTGWVLRISNRDKKNNEKQEAITICSNQKCDGNSLDANNMIYFKVGSGRWVGTSANTQLTLHDSECDGSSGTLNPGEDRQCDFFMNLKVKSHDLTKDMVGKCTKGGTDGVCAVGIGRP